MIIEKLSFSLKGDAFPYSIYSMGKGEISKVNNWQDKKFFDILRKSAILISAAI